VLREVNVRRNHEGTVIHHTYQDIVTRLEKIEQALKIEKGEEKERLP
jgi:hypothetical protein